MFLILIQKCHIICLVELDRQKLTCNICEDRNKFLGDFLEYPSCAILSVVGCTLLEVILSTLRRDILVANDELFKQLHATNYDILLGLEVVIHYVFGGLFH